MGLWKNELNPIYTRKRDKQIADDAASAQNEKGSALVDKVTGYANEKQADLDAQQAKDTQEKAALKKRSTNMQGGGRAGLMYSGNAKGGM